MECRRTTEYTEDEALDLFADDNLSYVAAFSHTNDEDEFEYKKSNRVFGGLQIGLQFNLGK